jgi:putative redox protein
VITATLGATRYRTSLTNGSHTIGADTLKDGIGGQTGLRPHELLEAALASCMAITLRMAAEAERIPLAGASVDVSVVRDVPGQTVFEYDARFDGELDDGQVAALRAALDRSAVLRTLSASIAFRPVG